MSVTVLDLGAAALRDIGVLASGETPAAQDAADFLAALNTLRDQWEAERLAIFTVTRTVATLTASQTSFTVGSGGNINVARPVYIDHLSYQDTSISPTLEIPVSLMTEDAWASLSQRGLTSTAPSAAYYEPTFPLGTLYPFPVSTGASLQWVLYAPAAVAEFAAISDAISLPPGYRRMMQKALAVELAPSYGRPVDPVLARAARESMAIVKAANSRERFLYFPAEALVGRGGGWDIRTGGA